MKKTVFYYLLFSGLLMASCSGEKQRITSGQLTIHIDNGLRTLIESGYAEDKPLCTGYQASEVLETTAGPFAEFKMSAFEQKPFSDQAGEGLEYVIKGLHSRGTTRIEKELTIRTYIGMEDLALFRVKYTNRGEDTLRVKRWINNKLKVNEISGEDGLWSFQGSSTSARADWILPVNGEFSQQNYMGMNNSDYGGGIPVSDLWRRDAGIAIGHAEMVPRLVSLPVEKHAHDPWSGTWVEKTYTEPLALEPGGTLETYETFVVVHEGDCFAPLRAYSTLMRARGMEFAPSEPAAFEPVWCAWGYRRDFTVEEVVGTLPKVKELGFKWAVIDDGFQKAEGDWNVNANTFPRGDQQMKELVDQIHAHGLKAKLWWAPLAVDPCSELLTESPDIIVYTEEWTPQFITWWDAYYMSPVYEKTIAHTKSVLDLFMDEWGFEGLKMDGQHMNAVGPDHHPRHGLDYPEEAFERLPEFFRMVYQYARDKKPGAVVENCPCGTCMSFFNMPYMNQAVSSDPLDSWQIRLKGKVYKALVPETAYYGDHVELSDNGDDFASSFGVGAVLGSKFTWPTDRVEGRESALLTPEKEPHWKKWIALYNEKMISRDDYLGNLYDIGFDKPETHVIRKDDTFYYAFYAKNWDGSVNLRGLDAGKSYTVYDYVNDAVVGTVSGNDPNLTVAFEKHLLVEVYPAAD